MIRPDIIQEIRRRREEEGRYPEVQLPLFPPSPSFPHGEPISEHEPEETTARVFIIDL